MNTGLSRPRWAIWALLLALGIALAFGAHSAPAYAAAPHGQAAAPDYSAAIRDGRAVARQLLKDTGAASLSLALVSGQRIVWHESFGYADTATRTPPTGATMYGIGSVSKTFAAIATMQLVDRGLVQLDAPVTRYLPEFRMASPGYRQITVRMLLDHSSGLPGSEYRNWSTTEFLPTFMDQTLQTIANARLVHTPGYMSVYCNDGFTVLEKIIQNVTGKSYAEYVQDEVLTPLGMEHSAYPLQPFADGSYAKCYTGDTAHPREVLNFLASGALYCAPVDLAKVAEMFIAGGAYQGRQILSPASVAEMGKDQTVGSFNPAPADWLRYGLGWDTVRDPGLGAVGVRAWIKGGDASDYHCAFIVAPKAKLAVAITGVAPTSSSTLETLGQRILLHALVGQHTLRAMPARIANVAPPVRTASAEQLAAVTGYWGNFAGVARIAAEPGSPHALTLSVYENGAWTPRFEGLRLCADGSFHARRDATPTTSFRVITAAGRTYLVSNKVLGYGHYRDTYLVWQKLPAGDPVPAAWADRVGRAWLCVNVAPTSTSLLAGAPALLVGDVPDLPGYVTSASGESGQQLLDPVNDTLAVSFEQIPGMGSRDLADASAELHGGEQWMRVASAVYRPVETIPVLAEGANLVTFASADGVWRSALGGAGLSIDAGSAWFLYDNDGAIVGHGTSFPATARTPAGGGHLLLYGPAGSSSTVTVTAAGVDSLKTPAAPSFTSRAPFLSLD